MIVWLLVAAAAGPAAMPSDLAPEEHQPQWIALAVDSGAPAFLDVAYRGAAKIKGRTYPVVLIRTLRPPAAQAEIADTLIAIDCQANAMSGLEVSFTSAPDERTGMRVSKKETLSVPFTAVYRQNEARVAPLFKHACGPDWSMKDPE